MRRIGLIARLSPLPKLGEGKGAGLRGAVPENRAIVDCCRKSNRSGFPRISCRTHGVPHISLVLIKAEMLVVPRQEIRVAPSFGPRTPERVVGIPHWRSLKDCGFGAVVSHISRKTSEMWGTQLSWRVEILTART